jgi:transposase
LRGHENILKRLLIHIGAFNISLILRTALGAGKPREQKTGLQVWFRAFLSGSQAAIYPMAS